MRVTSSTFPMQLDNDLNSLQSSQYQLEAEISSGLQFQESSDDPSGFEEVQNQIATETSINNYISTTDTAQTQANDNYQAMSNLQNLLGQASNIVTQASSATSTTNLQSLATEMSSIISQVVSLTNQQDANGNYLFGGTSNQQPIDPSDNSYNTSTNDTATQVEIQQGYNFTSGLLAGRSSGTPPVDGFLVNQADGVDTIATLTYIQNQLSAGNVNNVITTGQSQLQASTNLSSQYLAQSAAQLQALSLNQTSLSNQQQSIQQNLTTSASVSLANAATELQQTQNNYQAAIEAGAQIMNMSLLNYLPTA